MAPRAKKSTTDVAVAVSESPIETPEVAPATTETASPEQSTIDSYIESAVETAMANKPRFIEAVAFGPDFGDEFGAKSIREIQIHGKRFGYATSYRNNIRYSPVFVKYTNEEGQDVEQTFMSDANIKENGGLTGKQKAIAWLKKAAIALKEDALVA